MSLLNTFVALAAVVSVAACDSSPPMAPQASIELHATRDTLRPNTVTRMSAVVRGSDGAVIPNARVIWSTTAPAFLTIDSAGVVTLYGRGPAGFYRVEVEARAQGVTARYPMVVVPTISALTPAPVSRLRAVGTQDTARMTARGVFSLELENIPMVWSSSDSRVVDVAPGGVLRALAPGRAVLTVRALDRVDSLVMLTVAPYRVVDATAGIPADALVLDFNDDDAILAIPPRAVDPAQRPFIWKSGVIRLVDGCGWVLAMNDRRQTLCLDAIGADTARLAVWDDGVLRHVLAYPSSTHVLTAAINDSGSVGIAVTNARDLGLCTGQATCKGVWKAGTLTWLPPHDTASFVEIAAILNTGDIMTQRSIFSRPSTITTISQWSAASRSWTGGGSFGSSFAGRIADVNDNGVIVGTNFGQAFWWAPGQGGNFLPGTATSVNDAFDIIGQWADAGTAYMIRQGAVGKLNDLTLDRTWDIQTALRINNRGTIAALATNRITGRSGVVLLLPSGQ